MVALAVFATLFLRLWSLQVLNGQQLLRAAQNNQRRDIRVQAPRGPILDRNGQVLVTNVPGPPSRSGAPTCRSGAAFACARSVQLARVLDVPADQIGAASASTAATRSRRSR